MTTDQNYEEKVEEQATQNNLPELDVEREAEKLCRWAAARAGVIVVAPLVGTMALMANEVYMIMRLGELRGVKLEEGAVIGLLGSLGGTFIGQTLVTLIPLAPVQVPVGIAVTYGVGKVANAWLKAGQPEDVAQFREVFEEARDEGMAKFREFAKLDCKDKPLGDETKKFKLEAEPVFEGIKTAADKVADTVENKISDFWSWLQPIKEQSTRWLSAQKWEELSHGGLTVPYLEVQKYMTKAFEKSEFTLQSVEYCATAQIVLELQHTSHGRLRLVIAPEEFTINNKEAYVRLRIVDFDILDNEFATLIIQTMGTKLIMAIVNLIFDEKVIETADFGCNYKDNVLEVYFTQLIANSKLVQIKFMEKNVLDVVQFVALVPLPAGLMVKSKLEWQR